MTALAVQRHRCGTACWAAGCALGAIPPPEPVREQVEHDARRGWDDRNGGREVTARPRARAAVNARERTAFRAALAAAYDTVMREYFWKTWPTDKAGRKDPWDRAVVWRRLETGHGSRQLAEHFGVEFKTIQRILRRHEEAAGWRGKR